MRFNVRVNQSVSHASDIQLLAEAAKASDLRDLWGRYGAHLRYFHNGRYCSAADKATIR